MTTSGLSLTIYPARLQQAKDLAAANMTPEAAAARMTPEEAKRLSRVRNIGIAVREGRDRAVRAGGGKRLSSWDRHTSTVARPR